MRNITGNNLKSELDIRNLVLSFNGIKGQDKPLGEIVDAIERDSLGLFPRTKPLTFLFAGSSGVGKSETAKTLAQQLTGSKPIVLNMAEYHSKA